MRPAIIYLNGKTDQARLVDLDSVVKLKNAKPVNGIHITRFQAAIDIGGLNAGAMKIETDKRDEPLPFTIIQPWPCFLEFHSKTASDEPPQMGIRIRGFEKKAAEVLLNLAANFNHAKISSKWKFRKPAIRKGIGGPGLGWDIWLFVAAWRWSAWSDIPGEIQHQQMVEIEYPHDAGTLRTMFSRAGLKEENRGSGNEDRTCYR